MLYITTQVEMLITQLMKILLQHVLTQPQLREKRRINQILGIKSSYRETKHHFCLYFIGRSK